jgi:protein-S-isoprenylcysteine O-methyltransferase Ste14
MNESIFRIMLPFLIVAFVAHRGYYTRKHAAPDQNTLKQRESNAASRFAGVLSIVGFVALIGYVIDPTWLAWAGLPFPVWLRWTGLGIAILGFTLLQWAQNTLGRSWSDTPRMLKDQSLVTSGPYRWIRHPIYTAFLLILGSTLFLSANWLIGLAWTGMTALETVSRIGFEENLMLEYFGDQYRAYMDRTGRLLPKII